MRQTRGGVSRSKPRAPSHVASKDQRKLSKVERKRGANSRHSLTRSLYPTRRQAAKERFLLCRVFVGSAERLDTRWWSVRTARPTEQIPLERTGRSKNASTVVHTGETAQELKSESHSHVAATWTTPVVRIPNGGVETQSTALG